MSIAGGLFPFARTQWFTNAGTVLNAGTLNFFLSGTSTPQDVCSDDLLTTSIGTVLTLDSTGRTTTNVYLRPLAYKVVAQDASANVLWTADPVFDLASILFGNLGTTLTAGGKAVANNYTVLATDNFVTVNSSAVNPTVINLPAATARVAPAGLPLMIQNVGTNPVNVTPHGTDTINGANAVKSLPAVSGGNQPTYLLLCDGVSAWFIVASFATSVAPALGPWDAARAVQTIYQAATDGQVTAYITTNANGVSGEIIGYTDSSSTPLTVRARDSCQRQDGTVVLYSGSITFMVRKGDYWEVGSANVVGSVSVVVFWIPTGN